MEKYGDLITNGLDLISFLLVTPEIVRVITPTADFLGKTVAVMLALFVAAACFGALLLSVFHDWHVFTGWKLPGGVILVIVVISLIPPEVTLPLIRWIYERGSKHLFAAGVVLFLVSRLLALYGSAVKAGFL
jgi:hypothetical protein